MHAPSGLRARTSGRWVAHHVRSVFSSRHSAVRRTALSLHVRGVAGSEGQG